METSSDREALEKIDRVIQLLNKAIRVRGRRAKTRALQQAHEALVEHGRLSGKTIGLLTVEEYIAQLARKNRQFHDGY